MLLIRARWDGASHQERRNFPVHLLDHRLEQLVGFEFVNQQRILLLKAGELHVRTQVVHVAQVLLPVLVDDGQNNRLLQAFHHAHAVGCDAALNVRRDLHGFATVRERNQNLLVIVRGIVVNALDHWVSALSQFLQL